MKVYNYSEARQNFSTVLGEILEAIRQGREDREYKKEEII
jgi:hypothetical protein